MTPRPASPVALFPNLGQAVLLVLGLFVLQIVGGAIIMLCALAIVEDRAVAERILLSAWGLCAVVLFSTSLILVFSLQRTRETARRFFRLHPFAHGLIPAVIATALGLAILLSETDNCILHVLSLITGSDRLPPDIIDLSISPIGAAILVIGFAPFLEEHLFRGLILRGLLTHSSRVTAIVASSVLFSIVHGNIRQGFLAFVIGVTFAWWYARTRSVGPGMIGHAIFNGVAWTAAQLPDELGSLGLHTGKSVVVHEPGWFILLGVALTAGGFWNFNRRAHDLEPPPSPRVYSAADEPPLLEPPPLPEASPALSPTPVLEPGPLPEPAPLLSSTANQADPAPRAAAPAS